MTRSEIKREEIELIYLYFNNINMDNDGACIDHLAINLSQDFTFTYDYNHPSISLSKNSTSGDKNFWSTDKDTNNVSNISLFLGENGCGKTTIMRLLAACSIEHIEPFVKEYILIYYIRSKNLFYVKTTIAEILDTSSISHEKLQTQKISGYYGLVSSIQKGKLVCYDSQKESELSSRNNYAWTEMLPMECIYLPLTSDVHNTRFMRRKQLLDTSNHTTFYDILDFLISDYLNTEYHFMKKYPYFIINISSARQAESDSFNKILRDLYDAINIGRASAVFDKLLHFKSNYKTSFFIFTMLSFTARLSIELYDTSSTEYRLLLEEYQKFAVNADEPDLKDLYSKICLTLRNKLLKGKKEKQSFNNLLHAIEAIPSSIFEESIICGQPLQQIFCKIPINTLACNGFESLIEYINAADKLEYTLDETAHPYYLNNYNFSNMSTGEYTLITEIFTRLLSSIKRIKPAQVKKSFLLILDEPDATLHLRWTQIFIYSLIKILESHYPKYTFQIILTSHMPFLVTDFPRTNIFCLSKADWRQTHNLDDLEWVDGYTEDTMGTRAFHPKNGFMCNYYDLLRDAFFIDVPVGKFAQKKYEQLHTEIHHLPYLTEKSEIQRLQNNINLIDEPLLRKVLQEKLDKLKDKETRITELREKASLLMLEADKLEKELANDTN